MIQQEKKLKIGNFLPLLYCVLLPVYLELLLHLFVYGALSKRIVYPILFAAACGMALFGLSSVFGKKVNRVLIVVFTAILVLYFEIQFVYNSIFGEFMSVWQFSAGADAVTNFWFQMLYGIWRALLPILVLMLPVPLILVLTGKRWLEFPRRRWFIPVLAAVLAVGLHYAAMGVMVAANTDLFSVYRLYTNVDTATEVSVKNIGLLSSTRLELKYLLLGADAEEGGPSGYGAGRHFSADSFRPEEYNVMELDFESLKASAEDETLRELDDYFAAQSPTAKNEYTGLLRDYNLVVLCAESYSPLLISEELTPTLYRLSHGGFLFENYYGSYGSNTTNGEYTLCMGLYPDLTRSKSTASFYASQQNYVPFCLGNRFREIGADAWAYHNYTGEYYARNVTHPNMGYTFRSATDGLDMEISWPTSDLEMMEQSVDDFVDKGRQFVAYYMTFSGHYQYNWDNPMSAKNRSAVKDLPYSETVQAYIACNLELEKALTYLTEQLEQAGVADKTCIVLTNDHYPYGLSAQEYNELAGHPVDTVFEKYRSSFLCYVPGVEIPVKTYCSTVDILPTLLNLFGLEYDSRLLAGRDVLSEQANNYAVLSDQSFITPEFSFDASTGKLTSFTDREVDPAEVERIQQRIALDLRVSTDMLNNDYYAHAILGRENRPETDFGYAFTDIPETFSLGVLGYICDNGYMDPISETKFGFDTPATYAEFLDTLYRINGKPDVGGVTRVDFGSTRTLTGKYAPAVAWSRRQGLMSTRLAWMDSFTPLYRRDCIVALYRYARMMDYDTTVETDQIDQFCRDNPGLTREEVTAMCWCFENSIMRGSGTLESMFHMADQTMTRYHAVISLYNFHICFES